VTTKPIHSVDEFLSTFKVGDEFTVINSWKGEPHSISTHKIRAIMTLDDPENSMHGSWKVRLEHDTFNDQRFISDLVNNLHGCFVKPEDAVTEFVRRVKDHFSNPAALKSGWLDL
jgi:hypothetical protein